MKTLALASLLAMLAATATPATAGEHDHHAPTKPNDSDKANDAAFAKLDTDKDGLVAKSELSPEHPLLPHFGMVDKDKDGKLDRKEFEVASKMLASLHH